jgi:hypothetical protein
MPTDLRNDAERAFQAVVREMRLLGCDITDCRCDHLTAAIKLWGERLAMFRAEQPAPIRERHLEIRRRCYHDDLRRPE